MAVVARSYCGSHPRAEADGSMEKESKNLQKDAKTYLDAMRSESRYVVWVLDVS